MVRRGHPIYDCPGCGHRFATAVDDGTHVERVYADTYFKGTDPGGYPDYLADGPILQSRGRWYANLLRAYTSTGTIFDVGAAAGFILSGFRDMGWQAVGLEPNAQMAEYARTHLGLCVHTDTLEAFRSSQRFDVVTFIQVLGHLYDLRRALSAAAEMTRPGGLWLIETWNRNSITARVFGNSWHEYNPPSVLHWFSRKSLENLTSQYGLTEVAHGRPKKVISGRHARLALVHSIRESRLPRVLSMLSHLVPESLSIPYPAEDLLWIIYRKA